MSTSIRRTSAVALACAAALGAQARPVELLREVASDAQRAGDERNAALCELQDRSALDVATVVAALRGPDEAVSATAAAIVRHEWATPPPSLFTALDEHPAAAAVLLREFAQAPRPAARAWVKAWLGRKEIPNDLHCLLLAARGEPLAAREVEPLFATLIAGEASDGFHAAVGLLPQPVADALPGRLHALLSEHKVEIGHLLPVLDRMSADGWRRLMGLVVTLPAAVAEDLGTHLVQHDVEAWRERAAAALDGKIPLEAIWLLRAGPLLDRPARRQRVLALLGDAEGPPVLQARAFDALIDAGCVEPLVIRWALADGGDRIGRLRRVLDAAVADLPDATLAEWLGADQELARVTASALAARPVLGPQVETVATNALLECGVVEGAFLEALAMAVLQHGSEAAIARIWSKLRSSPRFVELVEALGRRRGPFAHERLLAELAAEPPADIEPATRDVQLDAVRLCLTSLGDRRQLAELVAHAKTRSPAFVRRCAHYARPLDVRFGLALLDDATAIADDGLAAELIGWAAAAPGPEVEARLLALWQQKEPSERQEVALRGLIAGSSRARLVQELTAALREGPLVERHEQLAYEVVATMPVPLAEADASLLAELVLTAPLVDPIGERARALRWPDGRFGFPLVAAVAQRLRGTDVEKAGAVFLRVSKQVMADPARAALSRQRLLVLWRSLEMEPEMQTGIGRATAALLLALPPMEEQSGELGAGPAHWFLIDVAARAGEPLAAATHARIAARALLRLPAERRTARLFLGERDPAAGSDPWAALAAAPFVLDAEVARAAGDKAAAAAALALAKEFAGRDAATLRRIEDVMKEISR